MFRTLLSMAGYAVCATNGLLGTLQDFLLDEQHWTVRYLVVEPNAAAPGRLVLISPISLGQPDWPARIFYLKVSLEQVANSPYIDPRRPITREGEPGYFRDYGYPFYWGAPDVWGLGTYPSLLADPAPDRTGAQSEPTVAAASVHLRSASEVRRYHVEATDGGVGHVEDFLVDPKTWQIRYLIVDTRNWWPGPKVLVAPHWASHVSWTNEKIYVDLPRDAIQASPRWDPDIPLDRGYEQQLHAHYSRRGYWHAR